MNAGTADSRHDWRSTLIVLLLLAAIVLVGALAWQAHRAARSHRQTAESVMQDYARLVADVFIRRTMTEVGYRGFFALITTLKSLTPPADRGVLPDPQQLIAALDEGERPAGELAATLFRVDAADGSIDTTGVELDPEVAVLLVERLQAMARKRDLAEQPFRAIHAVVGGRSYRLIYSVLDGADRQQFVGFLVDRETMALRFREIASGESLLPPALGEGRLDHRLLSLQIIDEAGGEIPVLSDEIDRRRAVIVPFGDAYGGILEGLAVQVAISPAAAAQLVIGGLPRSRVPLLLALLILTSGLLLAAIYVMRRERALTRLRSEFIARVSHELRTPLTQIRMFAETLLLNRLRSDDDRRRSLEIIDQEAHRLSHLVENILQYSRGERGAARVIVRDADLAPVIRATVESFRPLAARRGTGIEVDLAHGVMARFDDDAVRQVLLNLLDNALKFGPATQTITVRLAATPTAARFSVEDEGPGIPAEARERIWRRFHRLERDQRAAISGTGIGLTVVRDLIELQNGRVWIEPTASGGARFVVDLPAVPDDGAPVPDRLPERPEAAS